MSELQGDYPTNLEERLTGLQGWFADSVMPKARELGLVSATESVSDLASSCLDDSEHRSGDEPTNPRDVARADLCQLCVFFDMLDRLGSVSNPLTRQETRIARRVMIEGAILWTPMVDGYLAALYDIRHENSRRGANGRRLIGATTRDRTRLEAQRYRGKLSRFLAAPLIAEVVGKSPARVLKLLSELFPGESWEGEEGCDKSSDVA